MGTVEPPKHSQMCHSRAESAVFREGGTRQAQQPGVLPLGAHSTTSTDLQEASAFLDSLEIK